MSDTDRPSREGEQAGMTNTPEGMQLCFIDGPWAWFTSLPVKEQWGDDWDDAPYQHNAGNPHSEEGVTHVKVAFDGPLYPPGEGPRTRYDGIEATGSEGYFVAVEDMNRGEDRVPWLVETGYGEMYGEAGVEIYAGASIEDFIDSVEEVGGSVYCEVSAGDVEGECVNE